jgi:2-polyprenyl-3-methyl-5-hydroxy-6-metoxy-1,4-benzoquinol methylase
MTKAFDFGENWAAYSAHALTPERFAAARRDFANLMEPALPLTGKTFLDIGFGQGLSLISAGLAGARAYGIDINPKCADVLRSNFEALASECEHQPTITEGSILDEESVHRLTGWEPHGFDIVHSWGVLHHTGDMWRAIDIACGLVRPGGILVLALYNRHWSSRAWLAIKKTYVAAPRFAQSALNVAFTPALYLAKLAATRRNPLTKERGMDFYYDVVDWIGGYPYECAAAEDVVTHMRRNGFECVTMTAATVPTGCNEFVFKRLPA